MSYLVFLLLPLFYADKFKENWKMDAETIEFKENVDAWIKQIRNEVGGLSEISSITEESIGDIQHNYELIHELRDEVEKLKQEINALKIMQIINLREIHKKF